MRAQPGDLVARLFVELFQTEKSACKHPRIEASRLGGSPAARAMLAIAEHGDEMLPQINRFAEEEGWAVLSAGTLIGDLFSGLRKGILDRGLDREKPYRATLLGLSHGVHLVQFLEAAARADGRGRIAKFAATWLDQRVPLVEAAVDALAWFATHPRLALQPAAKQMDHGLTMP